MFDLKPYKDCIIVKPDEEKSKIIELIKQKKTGTGKVLFVGDKVTDMKKGDTVVFGEFVGQDLRWCGEDLLVMREEHVAGVLDG